MKEIDCRLCENLIDTEKGCKCFGNDADNAVKKCAETNFSNYRKICNDCGVEMECGLE